MAVASDDEGETIEVISVGLIVGGTRDVDQRWVDAAESLQRDIADRRSAVVSEINVDIEVFIPGNVLQPDFEGVRSGYYRKQDNLLKVQVAVPWTAPEAPRKELLRLFGRSLDEVDAWAVKRRRAIDTSPLRELLAHLVVGGDI